MMPSRSIPPALLRPPPPALLLPFRSSSSSQKSSSPINSSSSSFKSVSACSCWIQKSSSSNSMSCINADLTVKPDVLLKTSSSWSSLNEGPWFSSSFVGSEELTGLRSSSSFLYFSSSSNLRIIDSTLSSSSVYPTR
eukprot:Lithocolla_globosa_v1_NODE_5844_length_1177_cov_2.598039.p2 type:complete len:137 gc:universal NODE_5844_length_1177_cov_2.598039:696-1106(+)